MRYCIPYLIISMSCLCITLAGGRLAHDRTARQVTRLSDRYLGQVSATKLRTGYNF